MKSYAGLWNLGVRTLLYTLLRKPGLTWTSQSCCLFRLKHGKNTGTKMASFSCLLEPALIQIEKQTRVEGHVLRDTLQGRCPCTWAVAASSTNRSPAHFKLWLALGFFFFLFFF